MRTSIITTNGTSTVREPAPLPPNTAERSDTAQLILAGYDEARRRDALRLHETHHWKLMALGLLVYCGVTTGAALWCGLRPTVFHAPVQLIQVNAQGTAEPIGPPQELLAYTPSDAQWMQMVSDWVRHRRWKGNDAPVAAADLAWVAMHTCTPAIADVQRWEKEEKPLDIGKRRTQVEITAVTKTDAPKAYNVLWKEWVTEGTQPSVEHAWAGTFTVGRVKLTHQAMVLHNRLGLCVTAYSWSKQP